MAAYVTLCSEHTVFYGLFVISYISHAAHIDHFLYIIIVWMLAVTILYSEDLP